MELYHNQVTRVQGPFSLRLFHRSWGLMLIQANLDAPCTLLDYPTLDRFVEELRSRRYDIVGISGIVPNFLKVKKMCELVREHLPEAKIVVGGHVANIPDLARRIDADHVVRGEGVRWFRTFLGEDPEQPIRHPQIIAGHGTRTRGHHRSGEPRRHGRHGHPVGRLPRGLQLLLHLGDVRRQGALGPLLPDRRRTVRHHAPARSEPEGPVVLHDGRELPAGPGAGPAALGTHGAARQGLGLLPVQFRQRAALLHAPSNSCGWG